MCLQEPLPGVPEPAGARARRGPAAAAGGGGPGDAGAARRAAPAAAPLRLPRGALQASARRGVFTGSFCRQGALRGVPGGAGARARPHPRDGAERAARRAAPPRAAAARARALGH